jgi:hypothetical protein
MAEHDLQNFKQENFLSVRKGWFELADVNLASFIRGGDNLKLNYMSSLSLLTSTCMPTLAATAWKHENWKVTLNILQLHHNWHVQPELLHARLVGLCDATVTLFRLAMLVMLSSNHCRTSGRHSL